MTSGVRELHAPVRNPMGFFIAIVVAGIAFAIGWWGPGVGSGGFGLGLPLLAVAALALVTLANWKVGLLLFLVWLVLEDLARKFLGNNMVVYFGKDVLVAAAYASFFFWAHRRKLRLFRPPFLVPLVAFVALGAVQMVNPNAPSLLYGLAGMRLYFLYVPLMLLGYALFRTSRDLERFLAWNLGIAGVVALLGIIQATIGPGFLNPQVLAPELQPLGNLFRQAPLGESFYRPNSLFVSDGRFAWYLLLMLFLGIGGSGFLVLRRRARGVRTLVFLGLALVAGAIVMSGSRGTFAYSLGSVLVLGAVLLWGAPRAFRGRARIGRAVRRVLVGAGIAVVLLLALAPQALGARWAFYYETIAPWSPDSELVYRTSEYPIGNFLAAFRQPNWVVGNGIGTASLGRQYVSGLTGEDEPAIGVESGYGVLLLEFGVLGPMLWLAWTGALVWTAWRVVRRLRGTSLFPVAFAIWWFALILLFPMTFGGMQPYQNFIFNAYLWLLVGMLFRLPGLAKEETVGG